MNVLEQSEQGISSEHDLPHLRRVDAHIRDKDTKNGNIVIRRYECANTHRFTTEERIKDELLQRELQPGPRLSGQGSKDWSKDVRG